MTPAPIVPYWTSPDGSIIVFNARWEAVVAAGLVPVREVALIHDDPQYGVEERTTRASNGRGKGSSSGSRALAVAHDFPPIPGDDKPYDPAPVLALGRPLVTWGANHYGSRLPDSPSMIVWDKRRGVLRNDNADGELAWTNLGGPLRVFAHLWAGMLRDSENGSSLHSTQKPVALSRYVFGEAKLSPGALVFVPHMGSGPDLPAAAAMGLRVIACDVEAWCCDAAAARMGDVEATARVLAARRERAAVSVSEPIPGGLFF